MSEHPEKKPRRNTGGFATPEELKQSIEAEKQDAEKQVRQGSGETKPGLSKKKIVIGLALLAAVVIAAVLILTSGGETNTGLPAEPTVDAYSAYGFHITRISAALVNPGYLDAGAGIDELITNKEQYSKVSDADLKGVSIDDLKGSVLVISASYAQEQESTGDLFFRLINPENRKKETAPTSVTMSDHGEIYINLNELISNEYPWTTGDWRVEVYCGTQRMFSQKITIVQPE